MKAYIQRYFPFMLDEVLRLELRPADVAEVKASSGKDVQEILIKSIEVSGDNTWVIKHGDTIVALFGVATHPEEPSIGIPWLLGSNELDTIKKSFIKYCGSVVKLMLFKPEYVCLTNYVSANHKVAIKWLKWLGFSFMESEVILKDDSVPFKQFIKWRKT